MPFFVAQATTSSSKPLKIIVRYVAEFLRLGKSLGCDYRQVEVQGRLRLGRALRRTAPGAALLLRPNVSINMVLVEFHCLFAQVEDRSYFLHRPSRGTPSCIMRKTHKVTSGSTERGYILGEKINFNSLFDGEFLAQSIDPRNKPQSF
jgi:hypothetical protein